MSGAYCRVLEVKPSGCPFAVGSNNVFPSSLSTSDSIKILFNLRMCQFLKNNENEGVK